MHTRTASSALCPLPLIEQTCTTSRVPVVCQQAVAQIKSRPYKRLRAGSRLQHSTGADAGDGQILQISAKRRTSLQREVHGCICAICLKLVTITVHGSRPWRIHAHATHPNAHMNIWTHQHTHSHKYITHHTVTDTRGARARAHPGRAGVAPLWSGRFTDTMPYLFVTSLRVGERNSGTVKASACHDRPAGEAHVYPALLAPPRR